MQAALILVLATLLATTWAKPTIAEDLTGLEDRLTKFGYAAPPTITENVDALQNRLRARMHQFGRIRLFRNAVNVTDAYHQLLLGRELL